MKILYKQNFNSTDKLPIKSLMISNCYLKEISFENDYKKMTSKYHHHAEYEIHMVLCGRQDYEIDSKTHIVKSGEFIVIPPMTQHRVIFISETLQKYSLTFDAKEDYCNSVYHGDIPQETQTGLGFISEEYKRNFSSSLEIIENRVFEMLMLLFRETGYKESVENNHRALNCDSLFIAKQFISDNIECNLSLNDIAVHCHLSTRQLTRKFHDYEGSSPSKYINNIRMNKIAEYLKNSDYSLTQISERFSYNNVYYFNTAFKKYYGMPPAAYRRMFR